MIVAALATAAALAAVPAPGAAPFGYETSRASPRHPALVLAPRPGSRAVLVVRFDAGAVEDGDAPGKTRLAQHALLLANRRASYADLVRELFAADGSLRVETGLREARFVLEADAAGFDRLAATLLDALLAPELDPARFGRARERAINDERDSTGRKGFIGLLAPKAIDDWRYGSPPYGERQILENLTLEEVRRHLAGPLSPANATIVVAGAFDARRIRAAAARHAGGTRVELAPPRLATRFSVRIPARREVYLVAFPTAFDSPARTASARIAAAILSERLHHALRDRGVGYSESVFAEHRRWVELLFVALPAHEPKDVPLGALVDEEVDAIREARFDDASLERNRAAVLAELEAIDRDPEALAQTLADAPWQAWYGKEVAARVRDLDRAALSAHLRALVVDDNAIRILYSPYASARGPIPESFRRPRSTP
jgi:predicted Zn-dependent peptidase